MKLIEADVTLVTEKDPFKKIELAGRTCYKSSPKEDSAKQFFNTLVRRSHFAMLEHATFVFKVSDSVYRNITSDFRLTRYLNFTKRRKRNLISGNLRALNEAKVPALHHELAKLDKSLVYVPCPSFSLDEVEIVNIEDLTDIDVDEFNAHAYFTFHFICDRGVSHELVRHRPASFAQESTRYCNYGSGRFGNELTFIKPAEYLGGSIEQEADFLQALLVSEKSYLRLVNDYHVSPQRARAVLPNALKTEVIMTANGGVFEHFFDLRSRGVTGAPHPDMKYVADKALVLFEEQKAKILKQ